ncbi:MAG: hypothetical protein C4519_15235 [Desulfobacteraceae bacterium]|nr:MAG: hypothetical protein C4519_15235 [Desulfobacteraceae bacterium]
MDPNRKDATHVNWIDGLGIVAGVLTAFSAAPQLLTTYRTRDASGLDLRFLVMLDSGLFLWAVYGIIIGSFPLIVFNGIAGLLWLPIIWMKIADRRPSP